MSDQKAKDNPDAPIFDMDKLTWADETEYGKWLNRVLAPNATPEDKETWVNVLECTMAKCLVSVPRHLLVKDAPAEIHWSERESFKWLRWGSMNKIHSEFVTYRDELQKK